MTAEPAGDLGYTPTHEWVRVDGEELVVGITDHAQSELTDVVFVDLPKVGRAVEMKVSMLVLESVKAVADVYAPATGTVVGVNEELRTKPGLINEDPYGRGWIVRLHPTVPVDRTQWLSASQYEANVKSPSRP